MQQSLVRRFVISIALGVMLTACTGAPGPEDANHALAPFKANLERILAEARTTLADLASLPEALGDDAAACSRVMLSKYNSNPEFTAFGAAHPDGTVFCLTTTQATPVNIADRSYFQRALQSSELGVGDYLIGRVTNKKSLGLAMQLSGGAGIVLAPIDLDWLNQQIAGGKLPQGAELVLLDSKGTILAHLPNSGDQIGKSIADSALGKTMLAQFDGAGEFPGLDGVTRIYAFTSPQGSNKNLILAVGLKK